jgi:peptidoglycan hydrolase-like protein with peptidoglycan-binding domain
MSKLLWLGGAAAGLAGVLLLSKKSSASPVRAGVADAPLAAQARELALMLATATKGTEDKNMVEAFQKKAGLKPDGLYGPITAKSMSAAGNLVPRTPFYWPANPTVAKNSYRAWLTSKAASDPARKDQWLAAAKAVV